jgi:hypothetical protein
MTLKIGKFTATVNSFQEASNLFAQKRDYMAGQLGLSRKDIPDGKLTDGSKKYRISYNGRIWENAKYTPSEEPVYSPSGF